MNIPIKYCYLSLKDNTYLPPAEPTVIFSLYTVQKAEDHPTVLNPDVFVLYQI